MSRSPSLSRVRNPFDSRRRRACRWRSSAPPPAATVALNARLGRADRRRLRVGEDDARHRLVVGLARLAEDVRRDDLALVLADVGQLPDAGDVADRPQALARAQARVDRDPVAVGLDADRLQADVVDARAPAGGDEQAVAAQLAAVVELEDVVLALAPRGGRVHAEGELDCRRGEGPRRAPRPAAPARAASTCSPPSTSATSPPRRRTACAISTPTGPPPSTSSRRGTAFMPVTSRFVQMPSSSRRPGTGGTIGSAPVGEDDVLGRVPNAVDLDDARSRRAGRGRGAGRCRARRASAPGRRRSSSRP